MFASTSDMTEATQEAARAVLTVANVVFASAERLTELNFKSAREGVDRAFAGAKSLLENGELSGPETFHASVAGPVVRQAIVYADSLIEITRDAQQEIGDLFQHEHAEFARRLTASCELVGQLVPLASTNIFNAMKSAVLAANSSVEAMHRAAGGPDSADATALPAIDVPAAPSRKTRKAA